MRTGLFVDVSNLYFMVKKRFNGRAIDYSKLLGFVPGEVICACAYGAQEEGQADKFIAALNMIGYDTKFKTPRYVAKDVKKADWDVGIAIDVVRYVNKLDCIVLGTGDGDFAPLVSYLRDHGIKVIVIGAGVSSELRNVANTVVEITESLLFEGNKNDVTESESSVMPDHSSVNTVGG